MLEKDDIVKTLLEKNFNVIKEQYSQNKILEGFSGSWLIEIIELSMLFGFIDLRNESRRFLLSARFGSLLAGALTNIEQKWQREDKKIATFNELKSKYPVRNAHYFLEQIKRYNEMHLQLTLVGKYEEALNQTTNELFIMEMASTLILLEKFEESDYIVKNYLNNNFYIETIDLIQAIEYARQGNFEKSIKKINVSTPNVWKNFHLARGLKELEPWGGYPFPDY